jgi:hypothetical protein
MNDRDGSRKCSETEKHGMTEREETGITQKDIVTDRIESEDDDLR